MYKYTYHAIEGTYPHGDDTSRDTDVAEGVTNDLEAVQWVVDKVQACQLFPRSFSLVDSMEVWMKARKKYYQRA